MSLIIQQLAFLKDISHNKQVLKYLKYNLENPESEIFKSRKKYLELFYLVNVFIMPFYLIKNHFQYGYQQSNIITIPLLLVFILMPLCSHFCIRKNAVIHLSVLIPSTLLTILIIDAGGFYAPGAVWMAAIPITYGIVLGQRGSIFGSLFLILSLILFYILEKLNFAYPIYFSPETYLTERTLDVSTFSIYIIISTQYHVIQEITAHNNLNKLKLEIENLLRIVIHDIANPVSICSLSIKSLKAENSSAEKKQKAIDRIEIAIETMSEILKQIRLLKSMKDGKISLNDDVINLQESLLKIVNLFEAKAELKNIKFKFIMPQNSIYIKCDSTVLSNVIIGNFISNAIKFSQDFSEIEIKINEDNGLAIVSVRDFGIGIPDSILKDLFSLDKPTSRKGTAGETGTGYGMPLAKDFAEKMGGIMSVKTWTNTDTNGSTGTEMTVAFPLINHKDS